MVEEPTTQKPKSYCPPLTEQPNGNEVKDF